MPLFRYLEGQPGQATSTTYSHAVRSIYWPEGHIQTPSSRPPGLPSRRPKTRIFSFADVFINSLVIAGYCKKHSPCPRESFLSSRKHYSTAAATQTFTSMKSSRRLSNTGFQESRPVLFRQAQLFKDEKRIFLSLRSSLPACVPLNASAYLAARRNPNPNYRALFSYFYNTLGYEEGTRSLMVALSNPNLDMRVSRPEMQDGAEQGDYESAQTQHLVSLLQDRSSSNEVIFNAYTSLPAPRITYLSPRYRTTLLYRFAKPRQRDPVAALRFLGMIDDMCNASLDMSPSLWASAISLAGKKLDKVSKISFQAALDVWRRMEFEGKVDSNCVVFNILFDLAIKAGQFKVADKIILEMQNRRIDFSRFGKVTQIFYLGMQGDAEGVRKAYHDFVKSGELVDTTVLNCVMTSLARTGHMELAEQMYRRMQAVHKTVFGENKGFKYGSYSLPSKDYASYREASKYIGRILGVATFLHDKLPENHRKLQASLPLTPDAKTFHIFLSYHAYISGDLQRFLGYVGDMEDTLEFPPKDMVYVLLLEGFAKHGGAKNSPWNYKRLSRTWESFLSDLQKGKQAQRNRILPHLDRNTLEHKCSDTFISLLNNVKDREPSVLDDNVPLTAGYTTDISHLHSNTRESGEDLDQLYNSTGDESNEPIERKGLYLGQRIIIACLKAHFLHGGPNAVFRVWHQIAPLWQMESRRLKEIYAVNDVLSDLLRNRRV
ncbi:hypothetical protein LOZ52_005157 [Ophidiomyces ophidiicola]|uniref:Uncharacterized protein n=1 Tax=Ophidiomyces ophidiicola TaxID=1387563 RepID=A0ACB8UST8_9EURO|nr:uncharacterized protein LOZ57_005833 [Ophidiomyces ophidiicola]KAI1940898.1 hypothetical protein LOZ57_005833 [Ophidiomyces ophidiicola]KAI1978730.1 hypothetical protein LOZ55_002440 [Ophidiomyces ophidiicola]KAI2002392.1 hypothetical protein LOZ50_004999 [Ophidiomyces ophidiicola]KAI2134077.1 hypothetical protein LOZ28_005091 [Ophidiomyces ophidiicola]KAI2136475.1 hypothetical protein LOZ27_006169 [Ophidiomyces ophidiicola]